MSAYYNEQDPFAAAWLRELIKAGLIADGEVDERPIQEVTAQDVQGFTQAHWFAGIGVWSYALRAAGVSDDQPVWTGSCPCQPWSMAGHGEGADDPRHLWPTWFELIKQCRPPVVFGEQTSSEDGRYWLDLVYVSLEGVDYAVGAADLCAASVGAPHKRQRLYFVADTLGERLARERVQLQPGRQGIDFAEAVRRSEACGMAHPIDTRRASRRPSEESDGRDASWLESAGLRAAGELADTDEARSQGRLARELRKRTDQRAVGPSGPSGDVGHAESRGLAVRRGASGEGRRATFPDVTRGFWKDAEWLWCRDGVWRAVEPGHMPGGYRDSRPRGTSRRLRQCAQCRNGDRVYRSVSRVRKDDRAWLIERHGGFGTRSSLSTRSTISSWRFTGDCGTGRCSSSGGRVRLRWSLRGRRGLGRIGRRIRRIPVRWIRSDRFDPAALPLADRHYNRRKVGSPQFVPPGRCLVLLTECADALWVTSWPFAAYVRHAWPGAWVNSLFRNESGEQASDLIREAVAATLAFFGTPPPFGMVSFVNPQRVQGVRRRGVTMYGYCYFKAGFTHVGFTKGGLWAWQLLPSAMGEPINAQQRQACLFV